MSRYYKKNVEYTKGTPFPAVEGKKNLKVQLIVDQKPPEKGSQRYGMLLLKLHEFQGGSVAIPFDKLEDTIEVLMEALEAKEVLYKRRGDAIEAGYGIDANGDIFKLPPQPEKSGITSATKTKTKTENKLAKFEQAFN